MPLSPSDRNSGKQLGKGRGGKLDLSNGQFRYVLGFNQPHGYTIEACALQGENPEPGWVQPGYAVEDFLVECGDLRITAAAEGLSVLGVERISLAGAGPSGPIAAYAVRMKHEPTGLEIDSCHAVYPNAPIVEKWIVVRRPPAAAGDEGSLQITRIDSFRIPLPTDASHALSFGSDWGAEFQPHAFGLQEPFELATRQGRSSKENHPWLAIVRSGGGLLLACPAWSGNWALRGEAGAGGRLVVSGGLHDWAFASSLAPGGEFASAHVVLAFGTDGDLNTVSVPLARAGRSRWYPANGLSASLPVEWNPWWSYEDKLIDEQHFIANAEEAARLGVEVCTMDAGWFGPADPGTMWHDYRGDWELVNSARFPGGVRKLADAVHARGMKFGLWCEIEAVGKSAVLAQEHPEYVATRDGASLGYLCFGSAEVREWAYRMLDRLIVAYQCDWIKLDFNLEPGAGCNCPHHGHGAGDGLYAHYQGYYEVLARIRARHPAVVLENCASGGLRIDLGMMRQAHTTFLSDTDWPEHSLQVFWGASTFLAASVCLHWSYSDWLGDHPQQRFNPHDPGLTPYQFDYYTRIAMLGGFGFSQKLPELPDWLRTRLALHIGDYKQLIRPFVRSGDLYRLTGQPQRYGQGERWAAFQYRLAGEREGFALRGSGEPGETDVQHLIAAFRLPGGEAARTIRLYGIKANVSYALAWYSEPGTPLQKQQLTGAELLRAGMELILPDEESSVFILMRELPAEA